MLEIEFVDRSVALAGKAFVSFFPLVIVVAAFMPSGVRTSIFTTLTQRLGIQGAALTSAKQAFTSAEDVRKATGALGLVLTFFFASSFTAAVQRVYLRAWRRAPRGAVSAYARGMTWLATVLAYMAILGTLSRRLGTTRRSAPTWWSPWSLWPDLLWWFTAWFLLLGHVRWRVLLPTGLITGVALSRLRRVGIDLDAERRDYNQAQFGLFGVALALTTWLSGAAICILVGACAGPVLAESDGRVGALMSRSRRGPARRRCPSIARRPGSRAPTPRRFSGRPRRSTIPRPSGGLATARRGSTQTTPLTPLIPSACSPASGDASGWVGHDHVAQTPQGGNET